MEFFGANSVPIFEIEIIIVEILLTLKKCKGKTPEEDEISYKVVFYEGK